MSSSLLPKNVESFADSSYWRQFFKKRGEKVFEWYGSYAEIGQSIEKYLKPTDRILQIGCGNSTLADDLYDNGYRRVISIDIVEDVIRRQRDKNAAIRPELEFHIVDITEENESSSSRTSVDGNGGGLLSTAQESYQSIVDKGTLDALLPPDCSRDQETAVRRMFARVQRTLAVGGRYVIVTLAQPEIVRLWVDTFRNGPDRSYILRVQQVNDAGSDGDGGGEWRLPTFLLVVTKLKPPVDGKTAAIQLCDFIEPRKDAKPRRLKRPDDLIEAVKSAQEYAIFCDKARAKDLPEELRIDLHGSDSSTTARYTIFITTVADRRQKYAHPYAIFVVPQGREHEWLFSTAKGRRDLCSQASARRLAVVWLGRDHSFPDLEAVKGELNERVLDFAPSDVAANGGRQIPYLSLGEDLGQRTVVFRGESECSGQFVVEDVAIDQGKSKTSWRRLVFLKSQNLIQSEAKLSSKRTKTKEKAKTTASIDWSYLACAHHRIMLAALAAPKEEKEKRISACLLGLGGGCLATFVLKHLEEVHLTTVELDPAIVQAAQQHFEFPKWDDDPRLECVVGDALEFVRTSAESNRHFDVVLLDVAGPSHVDGMSCPLPQFVEDACLGRLRKILEPNGVLAFNLVTRDAEKRTEVSNAIARHFPFVRRQSVEGELNEVLICFCESHSSTDWTKAYEKRMQAMFKKLGTVCQGFGALKTVEMWDIDRILEKLANL